jgi:mycothiol synthase
VRGTRVRRRAGAARLLGPPTGVDADAGRAITGPPILRRATLDDAGRIAEVLDECTRHFLNRPSSRDDALGRLSQGDPAHDFCIADDWDGDTIGFGHVWAAPPHEVRGFVRVRPAARGRGVGGALLSWLEPRARTLAREESLDNEAILTLTNWAQDGDAAALLERGGFSPLRHFLQMRIDLGRDLPEPVWPDGFEPRLFSSGADDGELFASFRDAFADHWGNVEVDEAEWWRENRDAASSGFDPSLWVVVPEDGTVTGFAICREREDDGEATGWISLVGVRPRWRGRGLGEALLLYSLHEFKRRGRRRAALNVDVDNTTGALRLYTKIGMKPTPAFTVWSKAL